MKKVLIVGSGSYIGESFSKYAADKFEITTVDARDNAWQEHDFTGYDSVLHVAGIAHVKTTKENERLYYDVNCGLAVEVAKKAKTDGVKQFVFLSSLYVYGFRSTCFINKETPLIPDTVYGKSKYMAEQELQKLRDKSFTLCFVRPPMVYGENCKGNFPSLVKLAKLMPVFPDFPNKRSMIYINNLCQHICNLIEVEYEGVTTPHNSEYVNTTELVRAIRKCLGKRTMTTRLFNPVIRILVKHISTVNKLFGDLRYEMQGDERTYATVEFEDGVKMGVL